MIRITSFGPSLVQSFGRTWKRVKCPTIVTERRGPSRTTLNTVSASFGNTRLNQCHVHRQAPRRMAVAHRGLGTVPEPAGARSALPAGDGRPRPRSRQGAAAAIRGV